MFLFIIIILISSCNSNIGKEYKLFYLGGQSNMDGYGYVSDLPGDLSGTFENVWIFHGNSMPDDTVIGGEGIWALLRPGHGVGFRSDGLSNTYSGRFGVEISFAAKMKELYPDSHIAILKYSKGGTSIDEEAARNFGSWDPDYKDRNGINQYDHFLATVKNALTIKDIDGDGQNDKLIPSGIIWMQGESDADVTEEIAQRYYMNMVELMKLIRQAFGDQDLPVVIGRISDSGNDPSGLVWEHGEIVRNAQHRFSDEDPHAAIVTSTDTYQYSDPWHYDSKGFIDLGARFAVSLDSLKKK
ncbi:MAG TPA: hypothetical protein DEQ09_11175 [Bacteroidales bacterium]|nr:hypothetical protein [Bacteroidales bacterium]